MRSSKGHKGHLQHAGFVVPTSKVPSWERLCSAVAFRYKPSKALTTVNDQSMPGHEA